MKPPKFDYYRPATVEEALEILAELGPEAKILAGGQSLVPMLNFRLARPAALVDINRLSELAYIRTQDGWLCIGALARHRDVERSPLVAEACPLLREAISYVGHPAIRTRGTVCGSVAHADPAAEVPAVVAALGGRMVARSRSGTRVIAPEEFFLTFFTTSLQPEEMLVELQLPLGWTGPRVGTAFVELARRHGDFALCGVAAAVELDEAGRCRRAALGLCGVAPYPVKPTAAEEVLVGEDPLGPALQEAARLAAEATEPESDVHAPAWYRRHLAKVLTERALRRAVERAKGGSAHGERAAG